MVFKPQLSKILAFTEVRNAPKWRSGLHHSDGHAPLSPPLPRCSPSPSSPPLIPHSRPLTLLSLTRLLPLRMGCSCSHLVKLEFRCLRFSSRWLGPALYLRCLRFLQSFRFLIFVWFVRFLRFLRFLTFLRFLRFLGHRSFVGQVHPNTTSMLT